MKPEFILQADALDILFENRNKEYGAYELRRHYGQRLKKSVGFVFLCSFLVYGFIYIENHFVHFAKPVHVYETPETTLINVDEQKHQIKLPDKPLPERRMAEIPYTKPVITRLQVVNPPPTQEELADKIISNKAVDGDKLHGSDIMPAPAGTNAGGTGVQPEPDDKPVEIAQFMPEFPGGMAALQRFLSRNLKTPRNDMEPGSKIRVLVRFVVDRDGSITGIDIEESGGSDFDNEVTRVMKKMPAWKPGKQNGRNVSVYFKMPVIFQGPEDN